MEATELAIDVSPLIRSGELLAQLRASRRREAEEALTQLRIALEYAAVNRAGELDPGARMPGTEGQLALAGEGAPEIAEFAVTEFAAAYGLSQEAGRAYLGQALELGHRLPLTMAGVRNGVVPAWRARRIAAKTMCLPPLGARWVDEQIAQFAGRVGPTRLDRLVDEAIVRFDPETAAQRALDALETRHATVTVDHIVDGALSTGHLDATLDVADALDLDATLGDIAADLAESGDASPLDVRRAKALGLLARGQAPLLPHDDRPARRRRQVVLHVHLSEAALRGQGDGIANLHTHTGHPLGQITVAQVREWCGNADVTVKPVLDLLEHVVSEGYQPSGRLREIVVALNITCAFPHCDRPADNLDLDHILEYLRNGRTASDNLAPLCRGHHRAKTFADWSYVRLGPAEYLWTSPHGYRFVTDRNSTRDVSPDLRDTG